MGSVRRSSWSSSSPLSGGSWLKKFRIKVRTALGFDVGRNGSRKNGWSRPGAGIVS